MPIRYLQGNILEDDAQALVNPVNCVGVMGAGLALAFKKRWPDMFAEYRRACRGGFIRTGAIYPHFLPDEQRFIVSFPTKDHWRDDSVGIDISLGLTSLAKWLAATRIASVAVPKLGCGLGGLEWGDVRALIEWNLADSLCDVRVYGEP